MILLAGLLMVQDALPPAAYTEIVVTGRRLEQLKRMRMTTKRNRKTGVTRCVFKRRSGDFSLDRAVCDAVLACVPNVRTVEEMRVCIAPTMDSLVHQNVPWPADPIEGKQQ